MLVLASIYPYNYIYITLVIGIFKVDLAFIFVL